MYSRLLIVGCTLSAPVALLPYRAFSRAHALYSSISLVPSTRTPVSSTSASLSATRLYTCFWKSYRITSAGGREEQASDNQARLSRFRGSELSALFADDSSTRRLYARPARHDELIEETRVGDNDETHTKASDADMRISLAMKAIKVRRDVSVAVTRHR